MGDVAHHQQYGPGFVGIAQRESPDKKASINLWMCL